MRLPEGDPRAVSLIAVIRRGDVDGLVTQLRAQPALARAVVVDGHGVSPPLLHIVADWPGHLPNGSALVGALVAAGADVDARVSHPGPDGSPETALHWAASSDDLAVLDALLDHGADIEAMGAVLTGGTPMSDAVVFAQWKAARRLLERGAATTLWQAAALGVIDQVQAACTGAAAAPRAERTNALWHACRGGQQAVAELLLDAGADINWIGHAEKTPLDAATESKQRSLVSWLRSRGAKSASELP